MDYSTHKPFAWHMLATCTMTMSTFIFMCTTFMLFSSIVGSRSCFVILVFHIRSLYLNIYLHLHSPLQQIPDINY